MDTAATKRDEGLTAEELAAWIEENRLYLHHWFFSTDLSSYVRGGRISRRRQCLAACLKFAPCSTWITAATSSRAARSAPRRRSSREIVARMEEHAQDGLDYSGKCYISNSACYDDARAVADLVEARFPKLNGKVEINHVGTTIGAHTGPGTVALFFWGDERTE